MPINGLINEPKLGIRITSKAQHEILAAFAEKRGSIKAASKEVGISNSTYSNWMNFKSYPSAFSMEKQPRRYERIIPLFEKAIGVKFRDVFPSIPPEALKILGRRQSVSKEVTVERITAAVEREKLSYTTEVTAGVERIECREAINDAMGYLNQRQREILKLRFGLDGHDPMTLEEVGHIFKVTGERIRSIESQAINKLQNPAIAKLLVGHAE